MPFLLAWTRIQLRRHRRALLVLALLVAVGSAAVVAAVSSARRTADAVDRLSAATLGAHALVLPHGPGIDGAAVRGFPEVEALTLAVSPLFTLDGLPAETVPDRLPLQFDATAPVDRPVVLDGRTADPSRVDEAVVTARFVESFGLGVGDQVTLRTYQPRTVDDARAGLPVPARGDGRVVPTTIVGMIRGSQLADERGPGTLLPSPGLVSSFGPEVLGSTRSDEFAALVRLRAGAADLGALRTRLAAAGWTGVEVQDLTAVAARARDVVRFEAFSVLSLGAIVAMAALILIAQAVARHGADVQDDLAALRALGLEPRRALAAAAAGPTVAGALGTAVGLSTAALVLSRLPVGLGSEYETALRPPVDGTVLAVSAVLVPALVAAMGVAAGRRVRARDVPHPAFGHRHSPRWRRALRCPWPSVRDSRWPPAVGPPRHRCVPRGSAP